MWVGNIAGRVDAITPIKKLSTTAMISSPEKISPSLPLLISMNAGMARKNSAMLPNRMKGLRPILSLTKPIIGCTNNMPTMIAMMINTPWFSL